MYLAALCFLGLAGLAVAVVVGMVIGRHMSTAYRVELSPAEESLRRENATWDAIRAAWTDFYTTTQSEETPVKNVVLSWGRTLSLCAGLCLVGILMETEFGCPISIDQIVAGLVPSHSAITITHHAPSCWQQD